MRLWRPHKHVNVAFLTPLLRPNKHGVPSMQLYATPVLPAAGQQLPPQECSGRRSASLLAVTWEHSIDTQTCSIGALRSATFAQVTAACLRRLAITPRGNWHHRATPHIQFRPCGRSNKTLRCEGAQLDEGSCAAASGPSSRTRIPKQYWPCIATMSMSVPAPPHTAPRRMQHAALPPSCPAAMLKHSSGAKMVNTLRAVHLGDEPAFWRAAQSSEQHAA